jgi:hypothetical protein
LFSFHKGSTNTKLGNLGRYDTDRILSIYVALPKVAKESKEGAIHIGLWCDIAHDIAGIIALNFANVSMALLMEQHALKNFNNCLNTNIYSYLETFGGQSSNLYFSLV